MTDRQTESVSGATPTGPAETRGNLHTYEVHDFDGSGWQEIPGRYATINDAMQAAREYYKDASWDTSGPILVPLTVECEETDERETQYVHYCGEDCECGDEYDDETGQWVQPIHRNVGRVAANDD